MSEEFRDEFNEILKRYEFELKPDDLRDLADDLRKLANRWEATEDII